MSLGIKEAGKIYSSQRSFFNSGITRPLNFRRSQLQTLRKLIVENEAELLSALAKDLNKPAMEAFSSELGLCLQEISSALNNLQEWMKAEKVSSSLFSFPSQSYIYKQPKGISLIIAPWNYPVLLVISPLIGSMAAGNVAIIKPSEKTPFTAELLKILFNRYFPAEYIEVILGEGREQVPLLMENFRFDQVFFTGSNSVGKKVAQMAATKLSPIVLELGGKSPAVVDETANLSLAAKRIAFGKWFNAGQTCVAPDYLLVQDSMKEELISLLSETIDEFFPHNDVMHKDYARIIDTHHFERIKKFLKQGRVRKGGICDEENLYFSPTLMDEVSLESPLMEEEIFGPILPVLPFNKREEALQIINKNPDPLAFYLFTSRKATEKFFIDNLSFGGGMVNNTILHLENIHLPFGGIGQSGYGSYHGESSFNSFTHFKPVVKSASWLDFKFKYPPYKSWVFKLVKKLMN